MAIKVVVFFGVIIPIGIAAIILGVFGVLLWRLWRVIYRTLRGLLGANRSERSADGQHNSEPPADAERVDSDG